MQKIETLNWQNIIEQMHQHGYALVPKVLATQDCQDLKNAYDQVQLYRKTVVMERYRFGLGQYKYYNYPLPDLIQQLRTQLYPFLAPIANAWFEALQIRHQFPSDHAQLLDECKANNQTLATALILKYGKGGFNTLHQDLYGEVYFPIQTVFFLNQANEDYTGGEFVMTEQIPRAQSKAIVLQPQKGDMLIFTTNFRPVRGSKGYYRVNMKHGVSEVREGQRYTMGIIFHDASS